MMQAHHPLGGRPLCGAQLRYLVQSEAGLLGGLSFSAAAWRLSARDRWIGWDDASRAAGLSKVVSNSRFLILPTVKVPNLASHVLSAALSGLAADWQARYGVRPVLVETFVDSTRYRGSCYRAANWIALGQTRGRGRQDRTHRAAGVPKDIWVYALEPHWRVSLCAGRETLPLPRVPCGGLGRGGVWRLRARCTTPRASIDPGAGLLCRAHGQCTAGVQQPSQDQGGVSIPGPRRHLDGHAPATALSVD